MKPTIRKILSEKSHQKKIPSEKSHQKKIPSEKSHQKDNSKKLQLGHEKNPH